MGTEPSDEHLLMRYWVGAGKPRTGPAPLADGLRRVAELEAELRGLREELRMLRELEEKTPKGRCT